MNRTIIISICLLLFIFTSCKKSNQEEISSNPLNDSDKELINYSTYCNDRFDMCIDYPSDFGAQPEPTNGDGRTFINKTDSAQIILYGYIDQSNEGLEIQLDIINEFVEIENLEKIGNGYEILGKNRENGMVHHERLLLKPDSTKGSYKNGAASNVVASLQFIYPANKSDKYERYWEKINADFE